ncbi:MAG: response regulator, partial [Spirochaetaceae bacterium]|nr:response regulator [Spirochaetaceae bacterium]
MKILIVDDSRIMRNIIKSTLMKNKKIHFELLEADNGVDAYKILETDD